LASVSPHSRCCCSAKSYRPAGIQFRLVEAHAAVRDLLRAEGLDERVGPLSRRISVADIVESFRTPDVGAAPEAQAWAARCTILLFGVA